MTASPPLIVFTALDILALALIIGVLACRSWLLPVADAAVQGVQARSLSRLTLFCLLLLSATSLALLLVSAQSMSGASYLAITPLLPTVLFHTHYGHMWIVRVVALAALWLLFVTRQQARAGLNRTVAMFVAIAVLAFTRSASGHAADAGDFNTHELVDWLHLLLTSIWAGSVIAAAWAVFPAGLAYHAENQPRGVVSLNRQGARISQLATAALGLVLASGIYYNAWRTLGHWAALWDTLYGHRLLLKLALVAAMLGLGAANRYLQLPYLREAAHARRFVRVLYCEAVVAVAVIVAVAVMINTAPPADSPARAANAIPSVSASDSG